MIDCYRALLHQSITFIPRNITLNQLSAGPFGLKSTDKMSSGFSFFFFQNNWDLAKSTLRSWYLLSRILRTCTSAIQGIEGQITNILKEPLWKKLQVLIALFISFFVVYYWQSFAGIAFCLHQWCGWINSGWIFRSASTTSQVDTFGYWAIVSWERT